MAVFNSIGKGLGGLFKLFGGVVFQAIAKWKWTVAVISIVLALWDAIKLAWTQKNGLIFLREIGIRSIRADAYIFEFLNKPLPTFTYNNLIEPLKLWTEFIGYIFLIGGMIWIWYKIFTWINPHGTVTLNWLLAVIFYTITSMVAGILTNSNPLGILDGVILLVKSIPEILNNIGELFKNG